MSWFYEFSKFVLWCLSKVWFRVTVQRLEDFPASGPVVIACNHASHLDPIVMGIMVPRRCWYVARLTLGKIPLVGLWMRAVGIIFIDRQAPSRDALGKVLEKLAEGEVVGMFPEGTRTKDGRLGEFQRGLLLMLKKSGAQVVPVGIRGTFAALPPGGWFPQPRRCSIHFGRTRSAAEVLADGGLEALRRDVAELCGAELVGAGTATARAGSDF